MGKSLTVWGRGIACIALVAGLTACNGDGSDSHQTADLLPPPASGSNPPVTNNPPPGSSPQATNVAPQIVGSPGTEVRVGQFYSFRPTATDANGDNLSFSITSKPTWASFNITTGRLTGTPDVGDVGSYEEIAISVNDGKTTQTLPQFAINVVEQSSGNVTLAWQAPTENTDGSPLTNLSGYKIHYGTESGDYEQTISINNSSLTRYVIENLSPGTYFFAITAVTANGTESDLSGEASKSI